MRVLCVIKVSICGEEFVLGREGLKDLFLQVICVWHWEINPFSPLCEVTGTALKHSSLPLVFAVALSPASEPKTRFPLSPASLWRRPLSWHCSAGERKVREGVQVWLQHWQRSLPQLDRKTRKSRRTSSQQQPFFSRSFLPSGCPNTPACCRLKCFCSTWESRLQPQSVREWETKRAGDLALNVY